MSHGITGATSLAGEDLHFPTPPFVARTSVIEAISYQPSKWTPNCFIEATIRAHWHKTS
jgi:hypothetical protein